MCRRVVDGWRRPAAASVARASSPLLASCRLSAAVQAGPTLAASRRRLGGAGIQPANGVVPAVRGRPGRGLIAAARGFCDNHGHEFNRGFAALRIDLSPRRDRPVPEATSLVPSPGPLLRRGGIGPVLADVRRPSTGQEVRPPKPGRDPASGLRSPGPTELTRHSQDSDANRRQHQLAPAHSGWTSAAEVEPATGQGAVLDAA